MAKEKDTSTRRWVQLSDREINYLCHFLFDDIELAGKLKKKLRGIQKTITKASAKGKGRNLQKWVAKKIAALIGLPYNQQDDQCLIHAREMGQPGIDIVLRGEALKRFPFAVECKSSEAMSMQSFITQASKNAKAETDWLVVYKCKMFASPVVIMDWQAFEKLFKGGEHDKTKTVI